MNYLANLVPVDPFEEIKQEFQYSVVGCDFLLRSLVGTVSRPRYGTLLSFIFNTIHDKMYEINDILNKQQITEDDVNLIIDDATIIANYRDDVIALSGIIERELSISVHESRILEFQKNPRRIFSTMLFSMLHELLTGIKKLNISPAINLRIEGVLINLDIVLHSGRGGSRGRGRGGRRKSRKSRKSRRHR